MHSNCKVNLPKNSRSFGFLTLSVAAFAFLPQARLARQNGQQRAKRAGGTAVGTENKRSPYDGFFLK